MYKRNFKLKKGYILQDIENEVVIFDSENSVLFTFNETAAFIFKRLKKGYEIDKIIKALQRAYEITEIQAKKDIEYLLKELIKKNIIN